MTQHTDFYREVVPRGCGFCHVAKMQGRKAVRTARLSEFWRGQSKIVLLDPNILACKDWREMLQELIDSKAEVNFSQGLDARLLTEEKVKMLKQIKTKSLHFAWDRYEDGPLIVPKLRMLKEITGWGRARIMVYVLMGDKERAFTEQDRERLTVLREIGCDPYVMLYDKESLPRGHDLKRVQRWVNWKPFWGKFTTYEEYRKAKV